MTATRSEAVRDEFAAATKHVLIKAVYIGLLRFRERQLLYLLSAESVMRAAAGTSLFLLFLSSKMSLEPEHPARHRLIIYYALVLTAIYWHVFDQHRSALSGLASHVWKTITALQLHLPSLLHLVAAQANAASAATTAAAASAELIEARRRFVAMMLELFYCHK